MQQEYTCDVTLIWRCVPDVFAVPNTRATVMLLHQLPSDGASMNLVLHHVAQPFGLSCQVTPASFGMKHVRA